MVIVLCWILLGTMEHLEVMPHSLGGLSLWTWGPLCKSHTYMPGIAVGCCRARPPPTQGNPKERGPRRKINDLLMKTLSYFYSLYLCLFSPSSSLSFSLSLFLTLSPVLLSLYLFLSFPLLSLSCSLTLFLSCRHTATYIPALYISVKYYPTRLLHRHSCTLMLVRCREHGSALVWGVILWEDPALLVSHPAADGTYPVPVRHESQS